MITSLVRNVTGIEREEIAPVFLMALYGFLAMTSYYLLKAPRNSIFVDRVGAENLSYIYILTAIFVTAVVLVYSRWVDRVGERTLLLSTFALLAVGSTVFWWLLIRDQSFWSSGAFYLWTKLYGLLMVSQFWLVGNLVFTTRQARRLFGAIGVGLILGSIMGSGIAGSLAPILGAEALSLLSAGVVVLCAVICSLLFPRMEVNGETSGRLMEEFSGDALRIIARSGHLRSIALLLGLMITVSTLLDWQMNHLVELRYTDEEAMTRFWGLFYMSLNVASVTIQVFFTGLVLRRWGVGVAMLAAPVALVLATVGVLAVPVLLAASLARGSMDALRYSLDQSTREVLYLPVPTETKYKVKPLIDLAVYRGGTGIGGVVLLVMVNGMGLGIRPVAGVALVLVAAWLATAVHMKREYVQSLVRSIRQRFASLDSAFVSLDEAEVLETLRGALSDDDPLQRSFALGLVEQASPEETRPLAHDLVRLFDDPSPAVRGRALTVASRMPVEVDADRVRPRLEDPEEEVRERAVRALCRISTDPADLVVRDLLRSERGTVRRATLGCLTRGELPADAALVVGRDYLEERWPLVDRGEAEPELREELALAAGTLGDDPRVGEFLRPLMDDPDPRVAGAALRSAGPVAGHGLLPPILEALGRPATRLAARDALVRAGDAAVPALAELLERGSDAELRREAPLVLARIPRQGAVDVLCRTVETGAGDWEVERRALWALDRIRRQHPAELTFDESAALMVAERQLEAAEAYESARRRLERFGAGLEGPNAAAAGGVDFLIRALVAARNRRREGVFHCLALVHPPDGVHRAYRTLTAGERSIRSNAAEWLEHTVGRELFLRLGPILDGETLDSEGPPVNVEASPVEGVLYGLWHDEDPAVRQTAVWVASRLDLPGVERRLAVLADDGPTGEIRGLARELGARPRGDEPAGVRPLDPVERSLLLRGVRVLAPLDPPDLLDVARLALERSVERNEELLRAGEAPAGLAVLARGRVEIVAPDGRRTMAEEGQGLAAWALVNDGPSPLGARAAEPSRILEIRRSDLQRHLTDRPELARGLLQGLAREARGGRGVGGT